MKIKNIKINSYGNLKNKEINFEKINIIYGKNESGKSTLINYIKNIFFGISKNKNGKNISDYEKYLPWTGNEFSGKIKYELDNKNEYEVFKDFTNNKTQIYDNQFNDISSKYKIDKKTGNMYASEQLNVDETTFLSTNMTIQKNVQIDSSVQESLLQRIANLSDSGIEELSYKNILADINARVLKEVGTINSKDRPINITLKNIEKYKNDLKTINLLKKEKSDIESQIIDKNIKLENEKNKRKLLSSIICILDNKNKKEEKIKIKKDVIIENNNNVKNLDNKIDNLYNQITKETYKKINNKKLNYKIIIFLILINIIIFIFIKNKIINISLLSIFFIYLIYNFIKIKNNNKIIKKENNNIENEIKILNGQIEILEKNNKEIEKDIYNIENEINKELNLEKEKIINLFKDNYSSQYILEMFDSNLELLIKNNNNEINNLELEIHKLKIELEHIIPKLEDLLNIEELLSIEENNFINLNERKEEYNLFKEILEEAYIEMKKNITPEFNNMLSKNINQISNGKYKKLIINDKVLIELKDGRYIPIESLSVGTIEQIYLSIRIAILNEITKEKLPILLDETFAYYDDERLSSALKYLSSIENQIIIFTCTKREKELLDKLNIEYNYIVLGDNI